MTHSNSLAILLVLSGFRPVNTEQLNISPTVAGDHSPVAASELPRSADLSPKKRPPSQMPYTSPEYKAWYKQYRAKNKEHIRTVRQNYAIANRQRLLESRRVSERKRWHRNKALLTPKFLAKRLWKQQYDAHYRASKREQKRLTDKRWRQANKIRVKANNQRWRDAHPDNVQRYLRRANRKYLNDHPELVASRRQARRIKMRGVRSDVAAIASQLRHWKTKPSFKCHYCLKRFPIKLLTIDHIVPIAKGGTHTTNNICASCKSCNCTKQVRCLGEWSHGPQQLLAL